MAVLNLTKINGVDAVDVLVSQITHYEHYDEGGYSGRRGTKIHLIGGGHVLVQDGILSIRKALAPSPITSWGPR